MVKKINPNSGDITIVLTLDECRVLRDICMEVLGNFKWKTSRKRALVLNKILNRLREIET